MNRTKQADPEVKIRSIFLGRLQRLIRLRHEFRGDLNLLGLRLLDRAIDATYRDCIDYGAADAARATAASHHGARSCAARSTPRAATT